MSIYFQVFVFDLTVETSNIKKQERLIILFLYDIDVSERNCSAQKVV